MGVEGGKRVLHDRPSGDLEELLGDVESHPGAHAAREEYCDVVQR
jgi:hypothetical protein